MSTLMSNFPDGFTNGLTIRGLPVTMAHPGRVFWVSNSTVLLPGQRGGSNSNDGSFNSPFSTVDYAIGRCTANRGDIIMVKPGHAENISAVGSITNDVAGVAIVGLGAGTLQPKFTWTATDATWVVSAANQSFVNLKFAAAIADVVIGIDVSGVDGLSWESCVFQDNTTTNNFIDLIDLATGADDLSWINCGFYGQAAANDAFINGVAHDRVLIKDCQFHCFTAQTAAHGLIATSGNVTNAWIRDCAFSSKVDGAIFIDLDGAGNTGCVTNCYFSSLDVAGATTTGFDMSGMHAFEVYVAGEADTYGIVGGGAVYNDG